MKKWLFLISSFSSIAFAKRQVATTTTDLAALVRAVGQSQVEVFAISKGAQDPHQVEAKPSFMVKLRNVDLVLAQGLELESAWLAPLLQGARNPKLLDKKNVMELGPELDPIEVQKEPVSRAQGDVHPGGNPHFQLDPVRLGKAAVLIAKRMGEIDKTQSEYFLKNAESFQKQMNEKLKDWQSRIKKTGISEVVTHHKTFSYFCNRFEIRCDIQLEPKPGIPPTASHIISVIEKIKNKNISLVLIENLYEDIAGAKLKQNVPNLKVVRVPVAVEGEAGIMTNAELIEKLVKTFEEAKP